jgi:bacterioferritin
MPSNAPNEKDIIASLNRILELELAGVVRYIHYSLMVFGHARIPIVAWMREQANEAMAHAALAGEHITSLGGHPSLKIGKLLETQKHDIDQILREAIEHETEGVAEYRKLLDLVEDRSVWLEEYARKMLHDEEIHVADIEKMLRKPGKLDLAR